MAKTTKRGRPRKPYRTSWGEHVNGLRKRKDGRWVIVDTGKTFVEPDERRAVAWFRRWEAEQDDSVVEITGEISDFESPASLQAAFDAGASLQGYADGSYRVGLEASAPVLWAWFREQLIERPEYAAEMTGLPELGRLADLPKPVPSPTLRDVGELYQQRSEAKPKQKRQAELVWDDFRKWMNQRGVTTLRQLVPSLVAEYGGVVKAEGYSAKYIKNRFASIRGVINFARKQGEHPDDIRHALDCCAVLQAPRNTNRKDPHPIEREDFHALLNATTDDRMKALLLCMLNLCMYPSEALSLDWGEVDLDKRIVVTDRSKTSVIRIGVLWDRTAKALEVLKPKRPRSDAPIFVSQQKARWSVKTVNKQFRVLREKAGVDEKVKSEDCRDGAYTAAIESGADLTKAMLLAGHAVGISDHYAMRKPTMVASAVEGIERTYFG